MRLAAALSVLCGPAFVSMSAYAQKFDSPGEVYTTAQAAVAKGDHDSLCDCLTPDSLEMWAWVCVIFSRSAAQKLEKSPGESVEATPESINAVLAAHGLTKDKINRAVLTSLIKPKNERGQVFSDALQIVKHKPRFIVDTYLELRKVNDEMRKYDPIRIFDWISPDYVELVIDDDTATATVPQPEGAKQKNRTVQFRKVGGHWLIHFPMDFPK